MYVFFIQSILYIFEGIKHFNFVDDLEPLVYIYTIIVAVILLYGVYRSFKLWTYGGQSIRFDRFGKRLLRLIKYGVLQAKVIRQKQGGTIHVFIYIGMIGLFIGTILRAVEYDIYLRFFGSRFLVNIVYLIFKLMVNISGVLAIIGIVLALIRRIFRTYRDLPTSREDYLILIDLLIIIVTGFILDAVNTLDYRLEWIDNWDIIGFPLAFFIRSFFDSNYIEFYRILWVFHLTLALASIALIPFTKLYHMFISGVLNTFFSRLEEPVIAANKPIVNMDKLVEEGRPIGAVTLLDLSWKQRMDFDACTQCARCHNSCPANLTGKPLSPMMVMLDAKKELHKKNFDKKLVPSSINPDVIWSCVTCGACIEVCPVLINQVETIMDLRRGVYSSGENTPSELQQVSYNIMRTGNPYGYNPADRETWLRSVVSELGIEIAREDTEYEYIYWLGCNASYDPNIRNVAYSLMSILKKAKINFAVILDEICCGEPARRIGDEYLFRDIVQKNSDILGRYKFKKLLVNCPHGYNNFKHEYAQYGVKIEVEHHTMLLQKLIKDHKISPEKVKETVTYHDPCYLARWNHVFNEPRDVIKSVADIKEMSRIKQNTFCCGGGGGHAFFDIKKGERISKVRMKEAIATGVNKVVVSCPFCNIMLRSEASEFNMEVIDIAELLNQSLNKSEGAPKK
ncbi:MAG: heterodisulfide reductase-related iron-sulfur binding cluster [Thermoprotei archaeon]